MHGQNPNVRCRANYSDMITQITVLNDMVYKQPAYSSDKYGIAYCFSNYATEKKSVFLSADSSEA